MQKINKFDDSIISTLSTKQAEDNVEFIVYGKDLTVIKKTLEEQKCTANIFNIVHAVGATTSKNNFMNLKWCYGIHKISAASKVCCLTYKTIKSTNIDKIHKMGLTGKGVTIAVIDTGLAAHFDVVFPRKRILHFQNFVSKRQTMFDDNGHGTFVAGEIASRGLLSGGKLKGVAPECNLVVLKALNSKGEASAIKILEAMQWLKENREKFNIKILCLSIGANPDGANDPLSLAAESLTADGICVVAAAGNSGPDYKTIKSPGISVSTITVGAVDDRTDEKFHVATFSSRGPVGNLVKPDILAPGVAIVGLSADVNTPYTVFSGTSMAAPIIAGFCALLIEKNKNLTPLQIKYIVKKCGHKIEYDRFKEGSGMIDANLLF